MTNEKNQQEIMFQLGVFEQQIQQLQQQIGAVAQAITDIKTLNYDLDSLVGKKDSEIMATIGRGIFVKAKLISEEIVVDVGAKNFVTKSIPETKAIISKQIKKLEEVQKELKENLGKVGDEMERIWKEK
jgi:prefoldin alpha subunit